MRFSAAFLGVLLLSPFGAIAAGQPKTPIYKKPIPKHVCLSAVKIDQRTGSCNDNPVFLKSAQACMEELKKTTDQVAKELKEQEGGPAADGQSADFLASQAKTAEAIAAQTFVLELHQQGLADLDAYFNYVVRPDDAESDGEILATPCYRDAVMPLDKLTEQVEKKIADTKKTLSALEESFATASDRRVQIGATAGGSLGSVSGAGVGNGGPGAAPPKAAPSTKGSSITGVESDAQKRKKAPKK